CRYPPAGCVIVLRSCPTRRSSDLLFMAVMPRSGGFSTMEIADMSQASHLLMDLMMFIGGGSSSTAGGIKVTTVAVLVLAAGGRRSEEHTSELQSRFDLVCRLLLEK